MKFDVMTYVRQIAL